MFPNEVVLKHFPKSFDMLLIKRGSLCPLPFVTEQTQGGGEQCTITRRNPPFSLGVHPTY